MHTAETLDSGILRTCGRWPFAALALASLLYWATQDVGLNDDSPGLLRDWWSLRRGCSTYYPLGYPVFLGLLDGLGLLPLAGLVTLAQHGLSVLATWGLYRSLATFARERTALVGAALAHLFPASLAMHQAVCSESLGNSLLVLGLWACLRWRDSARMRWAVAVGLLAGLACTVRVVPAVGCLATLAVVGSGEGWRRRWRGAALAVAVCGGVVAAACGVQFACNGQFGLANSAAGHLFNRVVNEQGLIDEAAPATRRIIGLWGPLVARQSEHTLVRAKFEEHGIGYVEGMALLGEAAREGLRSHAFAYAGYTVRQAIGQLFTNAEMPIGNESSGPDGDLAWRPVLGSGFSGNVALRRVRGGQALLWPILAALAVVGGAVASVRRRHARAALGWAFGGVVILLTQAAIERSIPRYSVPAVPFVIPLAVVAVRAGCPSR